MKEEQNKEVVAAITAAVQSMCAEKVVAVKIKRSDIWTLSGRQKI